MVIPTIIVVFWGLWLSSGWVGMWVLCVPFPRKHGRRWVLLVASLIAIALAGGAACIAVLHEEFRPLGYLGVITFIPLVVSIAALIRWRLLKE